MLRFRVKSSLSESRTVVMSSFTSSRLMMSSTRDELMFTFPDWPFALALKIKREKEGKKPREEWRLIQINNITFVPAESWKLYKLTSEISSLTFGLFGGVEPDAYSRSRVVESVRSQKRPKADSGCERRPDMSQQGLTQERPQQAQMIQSHNC